MLYPLSHVICSEEAILMTMEESELDYLLFSDTAAYADLVLNEDPGRYLRAVTQYQTDESMI